MGLIGYEEAQVPCNAIPCHLVPLLITSIAAPIFSLAVAAVNVLIAAAFSVRILLAVAQLIVVFSLPVRTTCTQAPELPAAGVGSVKATALALETVNMPP